MVKFILVALVVTVVGIIAFSAVDRTTSIIAGSVSNTIVNSSSDTLSVSITGEVKRTGSYTLASGSTLLTLIEAANGVTTNADSRCYNTEYVLNSGESYYIAPIYDNSNTCSTSPIAKVNINSADKTTLMTVSAFSSTISTSILDYREKNGSFNRLEELKNVTGIGNAIFAKARDYVTLMD